MSFKIYTPLRDETNYIDTHACQDNQDNLNDNVKPITHFLNPINRKVKSYLEDTRHMLIKIKDINANQGPLPDNTRLISIDVCAMYPSIPAHGVSGAVAASTSALLSAGHDPDLVNWLIRL